MNRKIIITGAARGIGAATTKRLSQQGHDLFVVASRAESFLENPDFNDIACPQFAANFAELDAIDELVATIKCHTNTMDVVINNLGTYSENVLLDVPRTDFSYIMDVNFRGPAYFTQQILPLLKNSPHGQIINICSIATEAPSANTAVYSASKAALSNFSKALRKEVNPQGIRVTTIHPAGVNTWNDPNPHGLLHADDMAKLVSFIVNTEAHCQIDSVTLSAC